MPELPTSSPRAGYLRTPTPRRIVGPDFVRTDDASPARSTAPTRSSAAIRPTSSCCPANTAEIAADRCATATTRARRSCRAARGTGYTGGAVPVRGGVVLSLERLNRILEIDEGNLLAVVEPNVITGDLQDAVERVGLFYPPDPASLAPIGDRRQRRGVRRRTARVQVRRDQAVRARARGRAADRRE